jgi:RNA polymerase sigma factor (sigma-70 family)
MDHDLSLLDQYRRNGDARAFQQLVSAHSAMVFAVAVRVTRDAALAEEVAQDTFLALARCGDRIRLSVAAWLHHVAWQKAANGVRGKVRRSKNEREAAALLEEGESPWSEIEPVVDEVMAELPEELRGLLIEHFLEQRTQAEMAKKRGVSQATVSRRIDAGLQQMRDRLRARGLLSGAGLAGLLQAHAVITMPASLAGALGKLALSGVGRVAGVGVGASGGFFSLLSMKGVVVSLIVVVGAGVVAMDLASRESVLMRWLGSPDKAPSTESALLVAEAAVQKEANRTNTERWAAEAREIWAKAPKIQARDMYEVMVYEGAFRNVEAHFEKLQAIGVRISRGAFDALTKRYEEVSLRRGFNLRVDFDDWTEVIRAWVNEAPREAVAWAYHIEVAVPGWVKAGQSLEYAVDYMKRQPGAWAAFVEAGPDPRVGEYARAWREESDDPGSIWSRLAEWSWTASEFRGVAERKVREDPPSEALQFLLRCPDRKVRDRYLMRLLPRLNEAELKKLADTNLGLETGLNQLLRAMVGEGSVSFEEVLDWTLKQSEKEEYFSLDESGMQQCMDKVYARWLQADPVGCLAKAVAAKSKGQLERAIMQTVQVGLTEAEVLAGLAESKPEKRDEALAIYYRAMAENDPEESLRLIANSDFVVDQVKAARPILEVWSEADPAAAAAWVEQLPPSEGRAELAAAIICGWVEARPQAAQEAVAFAQRQGTRLADYSGSLAMSIRDENEAFIAEVLRPLREESEFNLLVVRTGAYGMRTHESLQFMARQGNEGWQKALVNEVIRWFQVGNSRADEYASAMAGQDLRSVPVGRIEKLAEVFVAHSNSCGTLQQALDWLVRLPVNAGPVARAAAVRKLRDGEAESLAKVKLWVASAPIAAEEKAELEKVLGEVVR